MEGLQPGQGKVGHGRLSECILPILKESLDKQALGRVK